MIRKKLVFLCTIVAALCLTARTQAQATSCSNANLNGKYVFSGHGQRFDLNLLGILTIQHRVETEGYVIVDGSGNVTASNVVVAVDGTSTTSKDSGSYSIDSDCTGTLTLNDPSGLLSFDINLQSPTSGSIPIATYFSASDNVNGVDLELVSELDPPSTPTPPSCGAKGRIVALTGQIQGGSGAQEAAASILLSGSGRTGSLVPYVYFQERIDGVTQTKLPQLRGAKLTMNEDCSFSASVANQYGDALTFSGQGEEFLINSVTGEVAILKASIVVTKDGRGYAGTLMSAF
jgi:hypothetical protein